MKTKLFKGLTSILLVFLFMVSIFTMNTNAEYFDSLKLSKETQALSWEEKISENLWGKIESANDNEKTSVWIWFTDIDQDKVDKQVKKDTGLTPDNLAIPYEAVPKELVRALEEASDKTNKDTLQDPTGGKLKAYIKATEAQRSREQQRTDTYIKARRNTARNAYMAKNKTLVKELNLPTKEITFQSQLTPSTIVNLTKAQILDVAKSIDVVSVDFYDDCEQLPPLCEGERAAMRADIAQQQTGLTGAGVNVLLNDHGWVRPDASYYSWVNADNIQNVVNKVFYPVTNTSILTSTPDKFHPNIVTGTMQSFASDVNVYSVGYGYYADIEWLLINHNIHLINASINYSSFTSYLNDAPAKWFDSLVSIHNVSLIASGGNDESWSSFLWPQVISPSSGYNSIAAGAYSYNNPNTMHNYRYNPITGTKLVCYKPDMVIAANSTSEATPMLTGIASMMIQLKPSLSANPELIKAILMASCHRKVEPATETDSQENMADGLTQRQGAGAVDAYRAISIVAQGNYGVEEITSGSMDINMAQPTDGANINVSLAWLRNNKNISNNPNAGTTLGTLQELELSVYCDTNLMGTSEKKNTGKQMVYFPSSSSNDQYTIRITKASQNTAAVRYAYAWSTEETAYKNITFTTSNLDGVLSEQEVTAQLETAGIGLHEEDQPFSCDFDSTVTGIGNSAFLNCINLTNVTIRDSITSIGDSAFYGCTKLKSIVIGNGLTKIGTSVFQFCRDLTKVTIPDSVTSIEEYAFAQCRNLKRITIPNSVISIAPFAFYSAGLTSLTIPNSVTDIGNYAFSYCTGLTSLTLSNNITSIGSGTFSNCTRLTSIEIPASVTSINDQAFLYCTGLNNVYFKPLNAPIIGTQAFYGLPAGAKGYINYGASGYAASYDDLEIVQNEPDIRTIYFTNNNNWSTVNAYLWKDGSSKNNTWPGVKMTYAKTNSYNQKIYSITFDYNQYNMIIFNAGKGQDRTVNINAGANGTGYYLTGEQNENKLLVNTYIYK